MAAAAAPVTGQAPTRPLPAAQTAAQPQQQDTQPAPTEDEGDQQQKGGLTARYAARSAGAEGAGAILALFAYPLLVNALRGGPAQAKGWLAAKFINQPYGAAAAGSGKRTRTRTPAPQRPGPGPAPRPGA